MSEETVRRLYKHFKEYKSDSGNPIRDSLVRSDMLQNVKEMEEKFPFLVDGKTLKDKPKKEKSKKEEKE